ncbi:Vps62-related protein [Streptomyces sp. NBC_01431]|uniref:Vps62-related protein n=1 Tax=Streptomyces sp. NBC_01431 TaxID=2903863 RepID=UPI002E33A4EE|nr:Vps62-related protein [Streptomyces sp. NBC_01431]
MPNLETFGDIDIRYTTARTRIWSSMGARGRRGVNVWLPRPPGLVGTGGWRPLATYVFTADTPGSAGDIVLLPDLASETGRPMPLLRNRGNGQGPLASPVRYERIWRDKGSGASLYGSAWRPIPPAGYVALGDVWWEGWDTAPPLNAIWCVKKEHAGRAYARAARVTPQLWNDAGTGSDVDVAVWGLDAPLTSVTDTAERLFLAVEHTTTVNHHNVADPTPTSWVLEVPADVVTREVPEPPRMTSTAQPSAPVPVTDRIVRVPFTAVNDPDRSEQWKIDNSPFYSIRRQVSYEVAVYGHNRDGSRPAVAGEEVKTGITKEESETFTEKTTITVSASAGISFKALSVGASVDITRETGYESRTTVTQFEEKSVPKQISIPPQSAGVLWVKVHHLEVYRADDTLVGGETLTFRINNSFVVGEYPLGTGVIEVPTAAEAEPEFSQAPDIDWETGEGLPQIDTAALAKQAEQNAGDQPAS